MMGELGRAGDLVQSSNDLVWVLGKRYFYTITCSLYFANNKILLVD